MQMVSSAFALGAEVQLGEALDWILVNSRHGHSIVRGVTHASEAELSEITWKSFHERIQWKSSAKLLKELRSEGNRLQEELAFYREERGRPRQGEQLLADEKVFLETRAESLKGSFLDQLLNEQSVFVKTRSYRGPRDVGSKSFQSSGEKFETGESAPESVAGNAEEEFDLNDTTDVRVEQLGWLSRRWMEGGAVKGLAGSTFFGEGDLQSLFTNSGMQFTPKDLENIRNFNKIFTVLDYFGEAQSYMSAFMGESKEALDELMRRISVETLRFDLRDGSIERLMEKVRVAGADLGLNEVTYSTMTQMLGALKKSYVHGGELVEGQLSRSTLLEEEKAFALLKKKIAKYEVEIAEATSPLDRRNLLGKQDAARRKLDEKARALAEHSLEFVRSHDILELFANARAGYVGSDPIGSPVDLPDLFVAGQEQLDAWHAVYDRALKRSVNALIKDQMILGAKTLVGKTRWVVRKINKETGGQFTATKVGLRFRKFATHHARVLAIRVFATTGIAVSPELINRLEKYVDSNYDVYFRKYLKDAKDVLGWDEEKPKAPTEAPL